MTKHTDKTKNVSSNNFRRAFVLIATLITAIAIAVACALCLNVAQPVDVADDVRNEVSTSTTYSNKTGNLTAPGLIRNGDILNYTYTGKVVSVTLPRGQYKVQVWGAEGGGKRLSGNGSSGLGGYGGTSYGNLNITQTSMNLYICIGGYGKSSTSGNAAGGYNGGGQGYASSSGEPGNGGGGATHIAVNTNRGLLASYKNYKGDVMIVAGGGGGGGEDTGDWYGHGGGTSGVNGTGSNSAGHGTQSKAGTGGDFGKGGGTNKGDGGGGGGGYYGGGTTSSSRVGTDTQGGGGGSGYVNTSLLTSAKTATQSSVKGNGQVRIDVISVNQGPVSKNATIQNTSATNYFRGTNRNLAIAAKTLSQDADYSNVSGSTVESVYFTNGNSSNYDTLPAANKGLYLNSACTTLADQYLSWTWAQSTLTITEIKKMPRNGVDGCTQNGRLTLYTKMRDRFGTTTTRGVTTVMFYLVVNDRPITEKSTAFQSFTKTRSDNVTYEYRYGTPTKTGTSDAVKNYDYVNNKKDIYNPNGTGKTVFLPKAIAPTDTAGYTIYASDLFEDSDTSYDYVAFKTVAATSYSTYYSITYNASSSYASGLVPSITIKPTGARPPGAVYVAATITAHTSEKSTKVAIGGDNTKVTLVFRISNTRPYFASASSMPSSVKLNEPVVTLSEGGTAEVSLNQMIYDIDDATQSATFAQTASDVKVPTNEFIPVDMSNVVVPLKTNVNSNYASFATASNVNKTAGKLSSSTGEGITPTGFHTDLIAPAGSAAAATANVVYSFKNNKTIVFTARAATQYQYSAAGRKGDFYILVRVIDPSDVADKGIWYPIAIKVNSAKPISPNPVANFTLKFDNYTAGTADTPTSKGSDASQGAENGVVLTPISYTDAAGVLHGIGTTSYDFTGVDSKHAEPFAVDPDTFAYSGSGPAGTRALNDLIMLNGTELSNIVNLYDTSSFFEVERVSLYASREVFSRLNMTQAQLAAFGVRTYVGANSENGYEFYGLRIKPLRATNDEYFQFDVNVKDSHGTPSTVKVCVSVANRALSPRRSDYDGNSDNDFYTSYKINPITGVGEYLYNRSIGSLAVNYTIERNDVIQITPYDFAYDLDIDYDNTVMNTGDVYNTNPNDNGFAAVADFVNRPYNIPHTSSPSSPANEASEVKSQKLSFINTANLIANAGQYASYISLAVKDTCTSGGRSYAMPCIEIKGMSRTTSAVVQLRFTISDGYSSVDCVITVTVLNSAPVLNPDLDPVEMSVQGISACQFTAQEFAFDKDGDTTTFVAGTVKVVAKDGDQYFETLDENFNGTVDASRAVYKLSDYVYSALAKNGNGADVVYARALSSTELFDKPIYLAVDVQDGFRAQLGRATLYLLINVKNSAPTFVKDGLTQSGDNSTWLIEYEDEAEMKISRYIANSKELCESSVIPAATTNKTWLFDDADAQQQVMLNPLEWIKGANWTDNLVKAVTADTITADMFTNPAYSAMNSAVIYTPTYTSGEGTHLNIEVLFYEKLANGSFKEITDKSDDKIPASQYWALKITDPRTGSGDPHATQIAIALKDDHHNKTLYSADKTQTFTGETGFTVCNFYYNYKRPGVMAMHTYYRTDGKAEANTAVEGSPNNTPSVTADWQVDRRGLHSYQFVGGAVPTTQSDLQNNSGYQFNDSFRYQYFVNKLTTQTGEETVSEPTYKHYPSSKSSAFYYSPIEVGGGMSGGIAETTVPLSYIAMPMGNFSGYTEGVTHVTFANATAKRNLSGGNKLFDAEYYNWMNDPVKLSYVFENLTLSDGNGGVYSGATLNDNPYITIRYTANTNYLAAGRYRNTVRQVVNSAEGGLSSMTQIQADENGVSKCREDKFGFIFQKKEGGRRAADTLKFTIALKTTSSDESADDSAIENVSVDILLKNTYPVVKYQRPGQSEPTDINSGMIDIDVDMTTSDIAGKTVAFNNVKSTSAIGDYRLYYDDPDTTDTMKFYLSSAYNTSAMPKEHVDHINDYTKNFKMTQNARDKYFTNDVTGVAVSDIYNYDPNPGFSKFFKVSPGEGAASVLQFIPVAKTQLNIPNGSDRKTYLDANHLKSDANGIYYPFKILFYDDISNSPITDGAWGLATFKIYIKNDPIKVNSSVIGEKDTYVSSNPVYNGERNYKFKLSKGTDFFVDVSSLLIDNDILLDGASFATKGAWDSLSQDDRLIKDYLVMPDAAGLVIKQPNVNGTSPVTVGTPPAGSGMSDTTLMFRASCAFKGSVDIAYTFSDSVNAVTGGDGSSVMIVFTITYNNEDPTSNVDTFNGGDLINITMKTGDSFTLYAADSALFKNDENGGFNSTGWLSGVTFPYGEAQQTAKQMYDSFGWVTSDNPYPANNMGFIGSLVIGSDDAPSTLRFSKWQKFSGDNDAGCFEITAGRMFRREDSNSSLPMSVTLKATGVVSTIYTIELIDGSGKPTSVNINITVLPTAPEIKTTNLPSGLKLENAQTRTFSTALSYGNGEYVRFAIKDFMSDADEGDINNIEVFKNVDNSYFNILNPDGVSAVSATVEEVVGVKYIYIYANDFIPTSDGVATVSFRLSDEHGAVSEIVTINVKVEPQNVKSIARFDRMYNVTLKSYAEYEEDGVSESIPLVTPIEKDAKIYFDADVNAPSAKYDVSVFALLKQNNDGTFSPIRETSSDFSEDECLLLKLRQSSKDYGDSAISEYVSKFFTVDVSEDGKTLEMIPNSATLSSVANNPDLASIQLYIVLSKHYDNGTSKTMTPQKAFMGVSVANSGVVAVQNSPFNMGYPMVGSGDDKRMRDSQFLEFSGTAGDSLTWDLYNIEDNGNNKELGLFYDYDMIRNPAKSGGLETLTYVRSKFRLNAAEPITGKGDILSVNVTENGKLTIKINRKVHGGQPVVGGSDITSTPVYVDIYCADTIGMRKGVNNDANLKMTTIKVNVENDKPEIKTITDPALIDELGYSIVYSEIDGYVLDVALEKGETLVLNIADIIDDADIKMDEYVLLNTQSEHSLMASDGYLSGSVTNEGTNDGIGRIKNRNGDVLFSVRQRSGNNEFQVSTLTALTFTCESTSRGEVGTCELQFRDSVKTAVTHVLTIHITVDNIAPTVKPDANLNITVMGCGKDATDEDVDAASQSFSILDFVSDANGDDYDATTADASKRPTYVFIDVIEVFTTDDPVNAPIIYGPNADGVQGDDDEEPTPALQVCSVGWSATNAKNQAFAVTPVAGVYGVQKVALTVVDSGYDDGAGVGVLDGKSYVLTITITIANPLDEVPDILTKKKIAYGVTRTVTVDDLLGEENARGYEIFAMEEVGTSNLTIYKPGQSAGVQTSAVTAPSTDGWRIYAKTESASADLKVTFKAGEVTRVRTLPVTVVANTAPDYKGGKTSYEYTVSKLDDRHKRTLKVYPEEWFEDKDEEDIMNFVGPVESSQSVKVSVLFDYDDMADGGRAFILLTFNRRGAADIKFNVTDLSGKLYEKKITVNCTDAPELSWWENFVSLIEANWLWFWIIVASALVFIILLIVLIVVVHKRRKMRREIEALLNSETELEEEMMRLSAGSAPYQSFGYLPPTQQTVNNPNLMIGGSVNNPTPNSLQLNAGTGSAPMGGQQVPPTAPNNTVNPVQGGAQPNQTAGNPQQNNYVPPQQQNSDGFNPDDF